MMPDQRRDVTRFVRLYSLRGIVAICTVAAVFWAICVHATYFREQRIAREIQVSGGRVQFERNIPAWMPQSFRDRLFYFDRIWTVTIRSTKMTPVLAGQVQSLKNLRSLTLNNAPIDDNGLAHLNRNNRLCGLKSLSADSTFITDVGLGHIKGLRNLEFLSLNNTHNDTHVSDAGLRQINELKNLRVLSLHQTYVTDAGLESLRGMSRLERLDITYTAITDRGLDHLKGLAKLKRLGLYHTKTTRDGREMLRKSLPNCTITPDP